ncbi:MAG: nucleoside-diphosphate kinase [Nanoarchaeota archaeon]|nr:nucleoside-diphosphate kinase [Nanoarchaeota archaeon]
MKEPQFFHRICNGFPKPIEKRTEKAKPTSLRGRFGRIHTTTDVFENVVHVSDAPETAEAESELWFSPKELTETIYGTKQENVEEAVWA